MWIVRLALHRSYPFVVAALVLGESMRSSVTMNPT